MDSPPDDEVEFEVALVLSMPPCENGIPLPSFPTFSPMADMDDTDMEAEFVAEDQFVEEDPYMLEPEVKVEEMKEEPAEESPAAEAPPSAQEEVTPQAAYSAAVTLHVDLKAVVRLPHAQWEAVLRQAYRKLCRTQHPDKGANLSLP